MSVWPVAAEACAVCFSGSPRIRWAFFNTTIFLTVMPLGMLLGGLVWLRRSGRAALLAGEFAERPDAVAPPDPVAADAAPAAGAADAHPA